MADAPKPNTVRALGALVIVILVVLLVVRYVTLGNVAQREAGRTASPHARYETAFAASGIRAMSSGADVMLAVGDDGKIAHYRASSGWVTDASPTHVTLRAVAQRLEEAIAVGDGGTIVELDGGAWRLAPSPVNRVLRAVVYTSYGVIAAGDGGTILRRTSPHEPWQVESLDAGDYFGACAGLRDVWVVGHAGAMASRDFMGWKVQAPVTPATLYAVSCDDHAGIAVGEHGTILARQGDVGWHVTSDTSADLYAVSASVGTTSWLVVGASGTVLRVSGGVSAEKAGLHGDLRAVTEGPLGTWITSEEAVLRRAP